MDPPDPGGFSRREEESGERGNKTQVLLDATDDPSPARGGVLDSHESPRDIKKENGSSNQNIQYDCKTNPQTLISDQTPQTQTASDVDEGARMGKAIEVEDSFRSSPDPPITKATLSELDVPRIVFNPKLRHDVNFDPDLHFRPNLDGDSGRRKSHKATEFWDTFQTQLRSFMLNPSAFSAEYAGREWCLPSTLRAVGEILATLVPPDDRSVVEEILDVEILMQQFQKGVADLEKLALWLSRTLKSHCAPMRDDWVDEMVYQLSLGNRNQDVSMLAQGLQTLLGILEAMKLDVANHQIRCLRPLLIQDTVEFEQTFFMKKIALRKIDVGAAHAWFCAAKSLQDEIPSEFHKSKGNMSAFFKGLTNIVLPSRVGAEMPETLMFDEDRIDKLRSDMLDAINIDICIRFVKNHRKVHPIPEIGTTSTSLISSWSPLGSPSPSTSPGACQSPLTSTTMLTLPKFHDSSRISSSTPTKSQYDDESMSDSVVWIVDSEPDDERSQSGSSAFSRRTSFSSAASLPSTFPLSRPAECPYLTEDESLRQSLLAIVDDTPSTNRWQKSCPAIALQLLRSALNLNSLSSLETRLQFHLGNPKSAVFRFSEAQVLAEFYPMLYKLAARYANLTPTQLFEVATLPRPLPGQLPVPRHALNEIAKQMAHIGVLHWHVWAPLAYLVNPDDPNLGSEVTETEPMSEEQQLNRASYMDAGKSGHGSPSRASSMTESIPMGG